MIRLRPGFHRFHVSKPGQGQLDLWVESRMNYYVKNSESFGGGKERLKLMDIRTARAETVDLKTLEGKDVLNYRLFVRPEMWSRN